MFLKKGILLNFDASRKYILHTCLKCLLHINPYVPTYEPTEKLINAMPNMFILV